MTEINHKTMGKGPNEVLNSQDVLDALLHSKNRAILHGFQGIRRSPVGPGKDIAAGSDSSKDLGPDRSSSPSFKS